MSVQKRKQQLRARFEREMGEPVFTDFDCCENNMQSFDDAYVLWLERKLLKMIKFDEVCPKCDNVGIEVTRHCKKCNSVFLPNKE